MRLETKNYVLAAAAAAATAATEIEDQLNCAPFVRSFATDFDANE